ncbi:MAG: S8 family peptidase, partial [Lachnospiraceae bacterium]|nr:S8 family peptidase [Lachnospiraceae bacterium]
MRAPVSPSSVLSEAQSSASPPSGFSEAPSPFFIQPVNDQYTILYAPLSSHLSTTEEIGYSSVPKLFTDMNVVSLEASGILPVRIRTFPGLSGAGVLVGFLDTGIDYTHPAFRNTDGTTRILRLWDQSDTSGTPPAGISYGTEYTAEQINRALFTNSPAVSESAGGNQAAGQNSEPMNTNATARPIPERDPGGHGTAVAGIACGSPDAGEGFTGVAPLSSIAFVRLKPAKQYLRDYFRIPESAVACQENDLMIGIRYLLGCAAELKMPLVVCLSLGTNQGGHTGDSPLEEILNTALITPGICAVTGTGNEVGRGHHYFGQLRQPNDATDAELLVDAETSGFSIEFWADTPDLYSLGFTSPLGETVSPIPPGNATSRELSFLLERSRISVTWSVTDPVRGSQLILLRFFDPTPGVWRIRIVSLGAASGGFHLWLPIHGLVDPEVRFYTPDADTTLVIPSCASSPICVGAWDAYNSGLYAHSGRGFTRSGQIRPDFAAPGVRVTCPVSDGSYSSLTGSCAAAALAAGSAALLLESGLQQEPPRSFSADEVKRLFLNGVQKRSDYSYPNKEWGYGTMNVYESFLSHLKDESI